MQPKETSPWYVQAFGASYLQVYPHRDLEAAEREVGGLLARGLGGRVLDLGCGFGRHALSFARAGVEVWGLDLSRELLARSRNLPDAELLRGRLSCGDFGALPFRRGAFDAVVMLFSSFGYLDEAGNQGVLGQIARILAPRGQVLFDLMNPERIRLGLVPFSRTERDGFVIEETRRLTEWGRRVQKEVLVTDNQGREERWREDVRLYGYEELRALLAPLGLAIERIEGDFDGGPFRPDSSRQLVWARRRA